MYSKPFPFSLSPLTEPYCHRALPGDRFTAAIPKVMLKISNQVGTTWSSPQALYRLVYREV
ncbi:hypothetical protein H6G96_35185 [Nostoc sp. FACHB-892]|uniref:hypothetical protein n=1 Tax=Nostoc sp. FACHB-892 TaxID=2692843 RepID=UPI001686FBA9|nr:hypothetical protein [Nostoc sp. FACHB-892]MBD2731401.1 hypothetical protein [Nostoc sp. FACHB-892]